METMRPASPTTSRQPCADAGLDADPGRDRRREHRRRGRPRSWASNHSRQGIDTTRAATPPAASRSRAADGELDLRAGADQDHVRACRLSSIEQDIAAAVRRLVVSAKPSSPRGNDRHVLPGQAERGRAVGVRRGLRAPAGGGLVGVGRTYDVEAGDRPQRGEVLDRLVGGAVLAEPDRVVGPHVGHRQLHQGAPAGPRRACSRRRSGRCRRRRGCRRERDAVHDRAHGVLADAEVQDPAL